MKTSMTSFCAFALTGSLVLGGILSPNEATASVYRDTSAGGACKPAYGASNKFLFNNNFLENIGTTDQYVVCHFAMDDPTNNETDPEFLDVLFTAGAAGGTATCVAQTGYHWGTTDLSSSVAAGVTLGTGEYGSVEWDESLLTREGYAFNTLTLNCKVPGSWRMGLIQYWTFD